MDAVFNIKEQLGLEYDNFNFRTQNDNLQRIDIQVAGGLTKEDVNTFSSLVAQEIEAEYKISVNLTANRLQVRVNV